MKPALFLVLSLVSGSAISTAAVLEYRGTGVFDESWPDTPYSAPNQPFDFRFTIPSEPLPETVGVNYFGVPTTVTLAVGSRPVLVSDVEVRFIEAGAFSGFSIVFGDDFGLGFGAMGLFTGPLTSPTMQSGTFALPGGTLTVTPVPEPASVGCALGGMMALLAVRLVRRLPGKPQKPLIAPR